MLTILMLTASAMTWGGGHAQQAQSDPAAARFMAAVNEYGGCLKRVVQIGMTTKMEPAKFKIGFDASCKTEEARFRREAVDFAKTKGRSETDAVAEVDRNIANGRRIFAHDQETYVRTGKVPR